MWKRYSRNVSSIQGLLFLLALTLSGCTTRSVDAPPPFRPTLESDQILPQAEEAERPIESNPRVLTSLRLSEQARLYLESNKPDEAIRILERAVNLDPQNGRSYYFLAEAWLMKGLIGQAREFNQLADIYLEKQDSSWRKRVLQQKEKLDRAY